MAVPGSPLDPRAQGCNLLIREGATLIQTADDVLEAIRPGAIPKPRLAPARNIASPASDAGDAERKMLAELLGPTPVPVDELIRQSGLAPALVPTILLELELAGRLERHAGGKVSACQDA
jgi:DNA processing protein